MSEAQYASVSWDNLEFNKGRGGDFQKRDPDLFVKLVNGDNEMRVLSDPKLYVFHNWTPAGDDIDADKVLKAAKYGFTIKCSKPHGSCPMCALKVETREKHMILVLSRATKRVQILDAPATITKQLKALRDNKKWGALNRYDINVFKKKDVAPKDMYQVMPSPQDPLTAEELELFNKFDMNLLASQVVPPTPERTQEHMDRILAKVRKDSAAPAEKATEKPATTPAVDMEFPAVVPTDLPPVL